MKKNKTLLKLLLISLLALSFNVYAAEIKLSGGTQAANVTKVPVSISISEGEEIKSVEFTYGTDIDSNIVSCDLEVNKNLVSQDGNKYTVINDGMFKNGDVIGTIILTNKTETVRRDLSVNLKNVKIGDNDATVDNYKTDVAAYSAPKEISSDASLSNVKISQGKLNTEFSKDVFDYVIYGIQDTINKVKFEWECKSCTVTVSGGASVTGKGTVNLNVGENIVRLEVVAEDTITKNTYQFKVYRGETAYNSANLASLEIIGQKLSPEFNKNTKDYQVVVANNVQNIFNDIKYTTEDKNAPTPQILGGDNLEVGSNKVTITVTNQVGDVTNVYTIEVVRLGENDIKVTKYINDEVTFTNSKGEESKLGVEDFKLQYPDEWDKIEKKEYKFDEHGNVVIEDVKKKPTKVKEEKKSNKTLIIVIIIIVSLIIIGLSAYFLFIRKKKAPKKKDDKEETKEAVEEPTIEETKTEEVAEESSDDEPLLDIDETGIEESIVEEETREKRTISVDEALEDLMNTKQYDFEDKE